MNFWENHRHSYLQDIFYNTYLKHIACFAISKFNAIVIYSKDLRIGLFSGIHLKEKISLFSGVKKRQQPVSCFERERERFITSDKVVTK